MPRARRLLPAGPRADAQWLRGRPSGAHRVPRSPGLRAGAGGHDRRREPRMRAIHATNPRTRHSNAISDNDRASVNTRGRALKKDHVETTMKYPNARRTITRNSAREDIFSIALRTAHFIPRKPARFWAMRSKGHESRIARSRIRTSSGVSSSAPEDAQRIRDHSLKQHLHVFCGFHAGNPLPPLVRVAPVQRPLVASFRVAELCYRRGHPLFLVHEPRTLHHEERGAGLELICVAQPILSGRGGVRRAKLRECRFGLNTNFRWDGHVQA